MADEREALMQKRKKWMEQRELEQKLSGMGISEQVLQDDKGKLLTEITLKLTEKFKNEMGKADKNQGLRHDEIKIEKAISKELESNTCPICLELMLPPTHSPILLFPCGHTFCNACIKQCLQKHKNLCPCCRTRIGSQAVNISLQNLICIHTDNKHLLDKYNDVEEKEEEDQPKEKKKEKVESIEHYQEELKLYEMRYKIVRQEKKETQKAILDLEKSQLVQDQVIKQLAKSKEDALKKMEAIKKELSLIDQFISQAEKEQENIAKAIDENNTKLELIDGTLVPIQKEKEKYELLIEGMRNQQKY